MNLWNELVIHQIVISNSEIKIWFKHVFTYMCDDYLLNKTVSLNQLGFELFWWNTTPRMKFFCELAVDSHTCNDTTQQQWTCFTRQRWRLCLELFYRYSRTSLYSCTIYGYVFISIFTLNKNFRFFTTSLIYCFKIEILQKGILDSVAMYTSALLIPVVYSFVSKSEYFSFLRLHGRYFLKSFVIIQYQTPTIRKYDNPLKDLMILHGSILN